MALFRVAGPEEGSIPCLFLPGSRLQLPWPGAQRGSCSRCLELSLELCLEPSLGPSSGETPREAG